MDFSDFEELGGSPILDIFVDRQTARREAKIAWSSTNALISHLFPTDGSPPASFSSAYPALRAVHCHIEPFLGRDEVEISAASNNIDNVNVHRYALASIEYTVDSRYHEVTDPGDDPIVRLTHDWTTGGEFLTVPSKGYEWSDGGDIDEEIEFGVLIPTIEHRISWPRIEKPPFSTIRSCLGKVNQTQMNFKTGNILVEALLFIGAELHRDILSDGSLGWEVTYRFSEKVVDAAQNGGEVGGWNYFWRNEDESSEGANDAKVGFYKIVERYVSGGSQNSPYLLAELNDLFVEDP